MGPLPRGPPALLSVAGAAVGSRRLPVLPISAPCKLFARSCANRCPGAAQGVRRIPGHGRLWVQVCTQGGFGVFFVPDVSKQSGGRAPQRWRQRRVRGRTCRTPCDDLCLLGVGL